MALQNINGSFYPADIGNGLDVSTLVLDASGEKAAFIFRIQKTGSLQKVGFRTGAVVQTQDIRVSFQDLTAAGVPDETQDQYRDISIGDTDDNVWKETGIISSDGTDTGSLRSVTRGDYIAVVFEHVSFAASDVFRVAAQSVLNISAEYTALKTGGSWAKNALSPNLALYYDDGNVYFLHNVTPVSQGFSFVNYNSGTAANKRGMRFQVPFTCNVSGTRTYIACAAGANYVVKLYAADGTTVLSTCASHDGDFQRNNSTYGAFHYFPTDVTLSINTNYYVMVEPSTANNVTLSYVDVNSAALMDQMSGGQNCVYAENTGGGAFAVTATRRPLISLIISALDDGVSAGGSTNIFPIFD